MAARHLVLIGLMGAGKTTVGARCAELMQRPFLDTDQLVEANARMGVADIFRHHGEQQFRVLERDAVEDACASPTPLVIACGGGAVLDPANRRRLRDCGLVVWLRASPAVLGPAQEPRAQLGQPRLQLRDVDDLVGQLDGGERRHGESSRLRRVVRLVRWVALP